MNYGSAFFDQFATLDDLKRHLKESPDFLLKDKNEIQKWIGENMPKYLARTKEIIEFLNSTPHCYAWKASKGLTKYNGYPDVNCVFHGLYIGFYVKNLFAKKILSVKEDVRQKIIDGQGGCFIVSWQEDFEKIISKI
jgi:hypothetical protein